MMIMPENQFGLKTSDIKLIRRWAVQFLYQQDINQQLFLQDATLRNFIEQNSISPAQINFLRPFLEEVFKTIPKIDSLIEKFSKNWKFSRIAKLDLAVLRIAIFEIMNRLDTDVPVIISEAAGIAHDYGSASSSSFVNGILDSVAKEVRSK